MIPDLESYLWIWRWPTGVVTLLVQTDIEGKVANVKVLESIPELDQAAVDAVKQWIYEPVLVNGKPKPAILTVTVRFALK